MQSLVEDHPELGYRSASEAATDAIRRHCEDLEDRLERGVEPPTD